MKKLAPKKKIALITATAALISFLSATAGGSSYSGPDTGFYLGANGGGYHRNMKDNSIFSNWTGAGPVSYTAGKYGWAVGGNLGYQLNRYWGLEAGGNWLSKFKRVGTEINKTVTVSMKTWAMYAGAAATVPIFADWNASAMLGFGYVHNRLDHTCSPGSSGTLSNCTVFKDKEHYWQPTFAGNIGYSFNKHIELKIKYQIYLSDTDLDFNCSSTSTSRCDHYHTPTIEIFTADLQYNF